MEMEVVIPVHNNMDFDFSSCSSPVHVSAPSTQKRIGEYYFSAPPSPSRVSQFYRDFEDFLAINGGDEYPTGGGSAAAVPFDWEEKPGLPKSPKGGSKEDDFAFDVSEDFEISSVSAEELFDGGVIKPLKPPLRLQLPAAGRSSTSAQSSPAISPRSRGRKTMMGSFSPRQKRETDPFATAAEKTSRRIQERQRGRERAPGISSSSRRATRSLSPLRVSEYPWEEDQEEGDKEESNKAQSPVSGKSSSSASNACSALSSSSKSFRKWSFKDFFLFRSASEGRAADKDPFRRYTTFRRYDEVKISSTRAIDSAGSGSMSRRKGPVSAHELHYTINRAVSEDLKKKTFLPYKQGILGRLAFNPAVHALANGFGFSRNV